MALKRELGRRHVFAVAAGAMISSGLFVLPYQLIQEGLGSSVFLCYLGALLLLIPAVLTKAELMTAMPKSGGSYYFIDRSLGPGFGTVGGIAAWAGLSLKSAFAVVGIGFFVAVLRGWNVGGGMASDLWKLKGVACAACVCFAVLNMAGVKFAGRAQFLLVIAMLLILWAFVGWGMTAVRTENFSDLRDVKLGTLLKGIGAVFIAFGGVTKVATLGEEVRNPRRDLIFGMFTSCAVVGLLYVLVVFVAVGVLPRNGAEWEPTPLAQAAGIFGSSGFKFAVSMAAIFAFVTTGNAGVLSASRTIMAISQDGLLPKVFGIVSERGTPVRAILFTTVFMMSAIVFLDLGLFVKAASAIMILVFMFEILSLILMRESRIPSYNPSWRTPLYPWVQVFGLLAYVFLLVELGTVPLAVAVVIVGGALLWYVFYARVHVMRESALIRVAARLAEQDFEDHDIETELSRVVRERDSVLGDRFDHVIKHCPVIDLDPKCDVDAMFARVSSELAQHMRLTASEIREMLERRENLSSTVIRPSLAIPHMIDESIDTFAAVLVRSRKGIKFQGEDMPVHAIFVLAASPRERNFYLRALMAIAEIAQEPDFDARWLRAGGADGVREVVLAAERRRDGYWENEG